MFLSFPPEARVRPSGLKARQVGKFVCPPRDAASCAVTVSQRRIRLSWFAVARTPPSGLNRTANVEEPGTEKLYALFWVLTSQTITFEPVWPMARYLPSGLKARLEIPDFSLTTEPAIEPAVSPKLALEPASEPEQ